MIKIFNLNLWNYTNWKERELKILEIIKKQNPDVITLQEVRDDIQFNKKGDNQAKQLNRELNYPYYAFYPVTDKQKERPEKYKNYCIDGTAVLSKFPILKVERKKLQKHKQDRYTCGNLYAKIKAEKIIDLIVVHFSNSNYFSLLHLLETLKDVKKRGIKPIIIGDFNIIDSYVLHELTENEFYSSLKFKKYISYPTKNETLDYVLIPKKFKFRSFECLTDNLSDHRALVVKIKI
ncbi:endonuclease/exonuclease/phosphatase family protein [Candidatus Woesearchaeota archaeon]|nr:endonuclease/exonuclease/phosphatase family protein [Candidatus Woesearchaeota archaeon]